VLTWKSAALVVDSIKHHTVAAETLAIVIWPVQIVIPIGMAMLLAVLILELYKKIKSIKLGETAR